MHREGFTNVICDLLLSSHKYISMHTQTDIGMYKCKINPQTKISFLYCIYAFIAFSQIG